MGLLRIQLAADQSVLPLHHCESYLNARPASLASSAGGDSGPMSAGTDIRDRALHSIELFRKCAANSTLGRLNWIERGQADFNLWTYGLKAASTGKSSLDYRVRERPDLRNVICDLLDGLAESLQSCLEAATEGEGLDYLEFDIKTVLKQLSRIHVAIRRAGNKLRHQRADNELDETLRLEEYQEWKQDMEDLLTMGIYDQIRNRKYEVAQMPSNKPLSRTQNRLIHANLVRRNRIRYAKKTMEESQRQAARQREAAKKREEEAKRRLAERQASDSEKTAEIKEERSKKSAPSSKVTDTTRQKPAQSENQKTATDVPADFKVDPAASRKSGSIITRVTQTGRMQDYPRWPKKTVFPTNTPCPYCAEPLSADYIENEMRWRFVKIFHVS